MKKRIVSVILCILMIVPIFSIASSADTMSDIIQRVLNHYQGIVYTSDRAHAGTVVISRQESSYTNGKYTFLLRYQESDYEVSQRLARGGFPVANRLVGTVTVNSMGMVSDNFSGKSSWNLYDVTGTFKDVNDEWFVDKVEIATIKMGLFSGTSSNVFSPYASMTRAMIVKILNRINEVKGLDYKASRSAGFSDVKTGQWYTNAINWATAKGIASGVGYGKFEPNRGVTREEIASFLYKYARYAGYSTSYSSNRYNSFADKGSVSSWATDSIKWCTYNGILSGVNKNGKTYIYPKRYATRAEVAAMVVTFLVNMDSSFSYLKNY